MLEKTLPQLAVARVTPNQVGGIRLKKILQGKLALGKRQLLSRLGGHAQKRILCRSGNVVLDLHHQRRHNIEVLMNIRKFVQQFDHAVIIFESVQSDPG